ncbi:hypothetical protein IKF28_02780 [Candidatus Saccharibacteria bacterium]|nr:hypothetical protein [Candidatus Saccharibacteria bacterium]
MATEFQLIKIEKIGKVCDKLPDKDVPKALSRGRIGYKFAIKSMMNAGQWAVASAIISVGLLVIVVVIKWINPMIIGYLSNSELLLAVLGIVCEIISGVFGYKLWQLQVTPLFALVALLFILCCNIFLFAGVIPIICVIMCVIALSRYTTFCSWFHGIK